MFAYLLAKNGSARADILSGITVALALVPEAVAFAFVAGVDPLVGLYAAFIVGLITSLLGGRPGMISGATGAMAIVMVELVLHHGVEYLFAAVVLTGVIQIGAGVLKLGKFVRMIPHPVMLGFVNGLAIVIGLAQKSAFMEKDSAGVMQWLQGSKMITMILLVLLTMAISHYLPKLTKAVPAPLVAIVTVTLLAIGFDLDTIAVGDLASVGGGLPIFHIPEVPFIWDSIKIILPYSIILASVGLIESLMTLTLVDELTETRGRANRECIGQGTANLVSGFFASMGGCAMIGQSMINVNSGGRGRLSGLTAALTLLAFIVVGSSLIEQIPMAALTGVMFMVVIGTFEWSSVKILHKIPRNDAITILIVTSVTVFADLAIAVAVGIIYSALSFAWESALSLMKVKETGPKGECIYKLKGYLFFASISSFKGLFDPKGDPDDVYLDFEESKVMDHSGLEAIHSLSEKYSKLGKRLHLLHLSKDCQALLAKAGDLVEVRQSEDPRYRVSLDELG